MLCTVYLYMYITLDVVVFSNFFSSRINTQVLCGIDCNIIFYFWYDFGKYKSLLKKPYCINIHLELSNCMKFLEIINNNFIDFQFVSFLMR